MTQIAYARTFDGIDDFLEMAIGGLDASLTSMSLVSIIKPVDAAATRDIFVIEDPLGFACGLGSTSNELYFFNGTFINSAGNFADASNGWMVIAFTKPSGSSTVRYHKYVYGTTTWTHVDDATGAIPQTTAPTSLSNVYIGGLTEFNGMIACVGYWATTALSDGQLEGMPDAIADWEALSPNSLWLLNQDNVATAVEDRTGTSDQVNRTGTTATAIADLAFDVGGNVLAWIRA